MRSADRRLLASAATPPRQAVPLGRPLPQPRLRLQLAHFWSSSGGRRVGLMSPGIEAKEHFCVVDEVELEQGR